MANINIGVLLHFYQPWWQYPHVLDKIVEECYRPLFKWATEQQDFAFSANINWSLLELLKNNGHDEIIELMRKSVEGGQVELFGTAAHHPILPLINERETLNQIRRDAEGKKSVGLPAHTSGGFYLPEYAFKNTVAKRLKRTGYNFTVADDAPFAIQHGYVPFDFVPTVDGVSVLCRSRLWGNALAQGQYDFDRFREEFLNNVGGWFAGRDGYVVLATDAETFGHHHKTHIDWLLRPMLENWRGPKSPVDILSFEGLLKRFGNRRDMAVPPGSWSTEMSDFVAGNHFPLWDSPDNRYHKALNALVNVACRCDCAEGAEDLLKVVSSCAWWWVSGRPFFNTTLMMTGADLALKIIDNCGSDKDKLEGHKAFESLVKLPAINR